MEERSTQHQGSMTGHAGGTTMLDQNRTEQQGGAATGTINQAMEQAKDTANQAMDHARTMARNIGDQARAAASDPGATAQELTRRALEQASAAGDTLYRQGQRAGEYVTQNVNEYPLTALVIAGMIGYGLAYLVHAQWQTRW